MNSRQNIVILLLLLLVMLLFGGMAYLVKPMVGGGVGGAGLGQGKSSTSAGKVSEAGFKEYSDERSQLQKELDKLSSELITDMRAEKRLNLNMTAQLRSYNDMLSLMEGYAKRVEREVDLIKEISKNEFQEDVKLQATLFTGKKPQVVAQHLEEFRATRVGAILAKMKEKEAVGVLDVWAKQKTDDTSKFYRQVMEAYLLNKRRDMNPDLFNKLAKEEEQKLEGNAAKGAALDSSR